MGHAANGRRADGVDLHLAGGAALHDLLCRRLGRALWDGGHGEDDDVRLHAAEVDADAGQLGHALGQRPRVHVVVGQPPHHPLEGHDAGRRDDAGLAHATPQHLAQAPGPRHDLGAAADHRAHRSAQALGEAERDGVDVAREIARVPQLQLEALLVERAARDAMVHHRVEHLREDRDHVEALHAS